MMSLGTTGLIMPREENFFANGEYLLIKPDSDDADPTTCDAKDHEGIALCQQFQPLVMFIGGAKDPEYKNVLEGIFKPYNGEYEPIQDIGYGSFQTGSAIERLCRHWHSKGQKICLIGHSYGGDTAMDVTRQLDPNIPIELVITLDPVSRSGPRADQPKPNNLKRWLNIYVDYEQAQNRLVSANTVAIIGGVWGECKNADINRKFSTLDPNAHAFANLMFFDYGFDQEVKNV